MMNPRYKSKEGICAECGHETLIQTIDVGIGSYEYWGARGNDIQLVAASQCCEADVLNDDGDLMELEDLDYE